MGNLKVGVRLGLGFGVVLALMVLLAGLGLSRMAKIRGKMDGITQDNMVEMAQLYAMCGDLSTVSIAVRDIALILEDASRAQASRKSTRLSCRWTT